MSRHLGLIIGVSHYQDSTFRPLQFAENDARALAQWLVNTKGGKWSPPDVQLVQGQHATRELIESLITQICMHKAEPGDVVLIYFSGHAFVDERSGEGYLALSNSRYTDPSTCVNLRSFTQHILARSQAQHILCVLDTFQSGPVWDAQRSTLYDSKPLLGSTTLNLLQQQENRLFLCSCRGNSAIPESGERNLGPLVHRMILGLCGPASESATGNVTLAKLHAYLFSTLAEYQRPQLFGNQKSPLILVGNLATNDESSSEAMVGSSFNQTTAMTSPIGNSTSTLGGSPSGLFKRAASFATMAPPAPQQDSVLNSAPLNNASILEQAQQLFEAQRYGEAFDLVERALQMNAHDTTALVLKGQLLGTAGRYAEALTTIDQLLQTNNSSALGWSMRAVALSNMGQHQQALTAIERSLELDAQNPETYVIKNNIMANLAVTQNQRQPGPAPTKLTTPSTTTKPTHIAADFSLYLLSLIVGPASLALLLLFNGALSIGGVLLSSLCLTLLVITAFRGSFIAGVSRLFLAFFSSGTIMAILAISYLFGEDRILAQLSMRPSALVPFVFLCAWLLAAAILPPLASFIGLIIGIRTRK